MTVDNDVVKITVKEARKLLGKDAMQLDDMQMIAIIKLLSDLAEAHFRKAVFKK